LGVGGGKEPGKDDDETEPRRELEIEVNPPVLRVMERRVRVAWREGGEEEEGEEDVVWAEGHVE
jgi:hypothetical protein